MLIRANFFELLSEEMPQLKKQTVHMLGILSHIDALMDQDIKELVEKLNVDDNIKNALIKRQGELFELLNVVEQLEQGNFNAVSLPELPLNFICETYMKSISSISLMLNNDKQT